MVVEVDKLVDVSDAVSDFSNRWVLESAFWVFASVVEDTSLLVDVVKLKWLKVSTLAELYVLQALNINDQSIRLSLGDGLLNFEVSQLQHVCESLGAADHGLRHHAVEVGSHDRVRKVRLRQVVHVSGHVCLHAVAEQVVTSQHVHTTVNIRYVKAVRLSFKNTTVSLLVVVALVVESYVSVLVFSLLEVHLVCRQELKVKDFNNVVVITVNSSTRLIVVVLTIEVR